jgi:hypothetical protein
MKIDSRVRAELLTAYPTKANAIDQHEADEIDCGVTGSQAGPTRADRNLGIPAAESTGAIMKTITVEQLETWDVLTPRQKAWVRQFIRNQKSQ